MSPPVRSERTPLATSPRPPSQASQAWKPGRNRASAVWPCSGRLAASQRRRYQIQSLIRALARPLTQGERAGEALGDGEPDGPADGATPLIPAAGTPASFCAWLSTAFILARSAPKVAKSRLRSAAFARL